MKQIIKSALLRFARGFFYEGVSAMALITPISVESWNDFGAWLSALGIACMFGALSGGLQALDKYVRDLKSES